ncbi:MAG: phosphotransferase [Myxococcaceae bacterium]|nr:phosphotransferase [Myxococcaceae bacterium]
MKASLRVDDVEVLAFLWDPEAKIVVHPAHGAEPARPLRTSSRAHFVLTDSTLTALRARRAAPNAAVVFDAKNACDAPGLLAEGFHRFHYVRAPGGAIRWIFPAGHNRPLHLALHNAQTIKAALYKAFVRACFLSGNEHLCSSGTWYCSFSPRELVSGLMDSELAFHGSAIFTGTPGDDRKATIALSVSGSGDGPTHFLKVPVGRHSARLVSNEVAVLERLSNAVRGVTLPTVQVARATRGSILLGSVGVAPPWSSRRFGLAHARALLALYEPFLTTRKTAELELVSQAMDAIRTLRSGPLAYNGLEAGISALAIDLEHVAAAIDLDRRVPVALGHCDFTPWNMIVGDGSIGIYDWELARFDVPLLYDLFHFVLQTSLLLPGRRNLKELIRCALAIAPIRALIHERGIDVNHHFALYLLAHASRYALQFARQSSVHAQAHWLVDGWRRCLQELRSTHGNLY